MNKSKKKALVTGNVIVVGVDIAKKKHWARIYNPIGLDVVKPFCFQNTRDGFYRLVSKIQEARHKEQAERVVVGMEPTGHYWKPLAWFLQQQGYPVVMVNPHHVKKSKELDDNSPSKTDRKDAGTIAALVQEGRFLNCILPRGVYAELRTLHTAREQERRKLNSALNRLQAFLDEYFPEFSLVFKNLLGMAAWWVLRNLPFPEDILKLNIEELTECLKAASNHRVGEKRAQALQEAARNSIGVTAGLAGARIKLSVILDEIEFTNSQLQQIETALAQALEGTGLASYLLSIPGIGVITAAGFLAEVGDLSHYEHWRQLQKLAGLNLVENSSGQKKGARTISKRGRRGLRNLLYQASLALVAKNKEFKALYCYLLTRPENPLRKKQALIAISMKILRVMFTLGREKQLYDPQKALGNYRLGQLQQAA